jgi:hypothetical protein
MNIRPIRTMLRTTALCGGIVLLATGCNKQADNTMNFTTAINNYYSAHPACLWADPIKFPVQADTSDTSKTSGYDALVDQGLLVRTTAEKKKFIIASKQVTNYDLSDSQVAHEVIPPPPRHVLRRLAISVRGVRNHQQVEILVRLDQRIHHQQRVVRRHVVVHRSMRQQQMPFRFFAKFWFAWLS